MLKTKNAFDTSIRYDQENNMIERFLVDLRKQGHINFHLQSCNVEAAACAVEAVGAEFLLSPPTVDGKPLYGQGDLFFNFMYSDIGRNALPFVKDGVVEVEILSNLIATVNITTTAEAVERDFSIDNMKEDLLAGKAIVISYMTDYGGGHFITLVAYDEQRGVFLAYDSWKANRHCKRSGLLEEYDKTFFLRRAREKYMSVRG